MKDTITLEGAKLNAIAMKNDTTKVVAKSLKMRERARHSSDITRTRTELARQGERIVESDYMQFWKDLQTAGVGSIIYGRKGKPDRFEWHYGLKTVAQAFIDGKNVQVQKVNSTEPMPKNKVVTIPLPKKDESSKMIYVPLRSNFDVEINLPANLTKNEAESLAKAILRAAV